MASARSTCDEQPTGRPSSPAAAPRRRGDGSDAIVHAVRELLEEKAVRAICRSARSAIVPAWPGRASTSTSTPSTPCWRMILADATEELDELTHYFAPRGADEIAGGVRQADGRQCRGGLSPTTTRSCRRATPRATPTPQIRDLHRPTVRRRGAADHGHRQRRAASRHRPPDQRRHPDAGPHAVGHHRADAVRRHAFLGDDGDVQRGVRVLEALWLDALWGGRRRPSVTAPGDDAARERGWWGHLPAA